MSTELKQLQPNRAEGRGLVDVVGSISDVLRHGDPEGKAKIYEALGLRLRHRSAHSTARAEANLDPYQSLNHPYGEKVRVRGGFNHPPRNPSPLVLSAGLSSAGFRWNGAGFELDSVSSRLPGDPARVLPERRQEDDVHRTLIVAHMDPKDAAGVAGVFAESDATELPHMVGVTRRTLLAFHGLYFHLEEAARDINPNLDTARRGELYQDINTKLSKFISPYDPEWKQPRDAMAVPFYSWTPEAGHSISPLHGPSLGSNT